MSETLFEITKAARLLMNGRPHELRVIGDKVQSGVYETPERLADAAVKFDGNANVYIGLNPTSKPPYDMRPGDAVGDANIERIRWLPVDIDNGEPPMPVVDYLTTAGFPRPIIASSGRGWWLLYHVDQPNTPGMAELRHRFLMALKAKFPGVDVSVSNASRVARMFGTMNMKDGAKRSLVSSVPDEIVVVNQALIEAIAADVPVTKHVEPQDGIAGDVAVYLEALEAKFDITVKRDKPWATDAMLYDLTTCPFFPNDTHLGAHLIGWADGNVAFKCPGDRCITAKHGILDLRELLDIRPSVVIDVDAAGTSPAALSRLVRMDLVKPKRALTEWDTRLNLYDVNAIVGDEKIGKGLLMARLIAELTSGRLTGTAQTCMYFSTEEQTEMIQVPRLMAAGADPTRVFLHPMESIKLPDNIGALAAKAKAVGATWVFIDNVNKHFTDEYDAWKPDHVNTIMGTLAQAMASERITPVVSLHTNRSDSSISRNRWAHSQEFRRTSRSGIVIGRTGDMDEDERGIVHDFNNYAEVSESLSARIDTVPVPIDGEVVEVATLVLGGEAEFTSEALFVGDAERANASKDRPKIATCMFDIVETWQRKGEPAVLPAKVFTGAEGVYGKMMMKRARAKLGIDTVRKTDDTSGESVGWEWHFRPDTHDKYRELTEKH